MPPLWSHWCGLKSPWGDASAQPWQLLLQPLHVFLAHIIALTVRTDLGAVHLQESPGDGAQRFGQPQGPVSASAPTSGSMIKSSALEDSARESYSPAELDVIERVRSQRSVESRLSDPPEYQPSDDAK